MDSFKRQEPSGEDFQAQMEQALNFMMRTSFGGKMTRDQIEGILLLSGKDKVLKLAAFEKIFLKFGPEHYELFSLFLEESCEKLQTEIFELINKEVLNRFDEQLAPFFESVSEADEALNEEELKGFQQEFEKFQILFIEDIRERIIAEFAIIKKLSSYTSLDEDSREALDIILNMRQRQLFKSCLRHLKFKLDALGEEDNDAE